MRFISRRVIFEKFKIKNQVTSKKKLEKSVIFIPEVTFSYAVTKRLKFFFYLGCYLLLYLSDNVPVFGIVQNCQVFSMTSLCSVRKTDFDGYYLANITVRVTIKFFMKCKYGKPIGGVYRKHYSDLIPSDLEARYKWSQIFHIDRHFATCRSISTKLISPNIFMLCHKINPVNFVQMGCIIIN